MKDEEHNYHDLYQLVQNYVTVCDYCTGAFGVDNAGDDADVVRIDEKGDRPNVRSLVDDDYENITY